MYLIARLFSTASSAGEDMFATGEHICATGRKGCAIVRKVFDQVADNLSPVKQNRND